MGTDNPEFGVGGGRDVYVEEDLAPRAREILSVPEFSDDELAALSEQAGRDPAGEPPPSAASSR